MSFTIHDVLKTRINAMRQPAPVLQFYELTLPDGSFIRVVDFADRTAGGTLDTKVPFNGVEFAAVSLERSDIADSSEGTRQQFTLTVLDPFHTYASLLWTYEGFAGLKLKSWIIPQDQLSTPEVGSFMEFQTISGNLSDSPSAIVLTVGFVNLYEKQYPKLFFDRNRCWNEYHNRFIVGNDCHYPSIEFSQQTEFDFLMGGELFLKERLAGWSTQQANRATYFSSNIHILGKLRMRSRDPIHSWFGQKRYGLALHRDIDGNFDVNCDLGSLDGANRAGWLFGLLVQDQTDASPDMEVGEELPVTPTSSWLIWGRQDNGAGGSRMCARVTAADVTSDTTVAFTDSSIRVKRIGTSWELYSRANDTVPWTLRYTATLTLPNTVRVGVVISANSETDNEFGADFDWIHFEAGGLSSCLRTFEDCLLHSNTAQFNGFRELPDDKLQS